jgi:hypothetical protein
MKDRPSEQWANLSEERREILKARTKAWRYKNPSRSIWMNVRLRAKAKDIPFDIEIEDIVIPEYCPVLGCKLKTGPGKLVANSPSLDRIIPALGYVKGNIIVISHKANMIKSNATPEEIIQVGNFFKRLYEEQFKPA